MQASCLRRSGQDAHIPVTAKLFSGFAPQEEILRYNLTMIQIITIQNYKSIQDLTLELGRVNILIGANGAGKSTTLRSIMALEKPSKGTISYIGKNITSMRTRDIVGEGLVLVPEGRRVFSNLTVKENLILGAYLRKDKEENACHFTV